MAGIRLRLRRGYRAEVVEVPAQDVLLGSHRDCGVVVEGAAERHAWLRPRRGRLILAPVAGAARRPSMANVRIDAPVVLAPGARFHLGDVLVAPSLSDDLSGLTGRQIAGWRCDREIGSERLRRRIWSASSPRGPGRVHVLADPPDGWRRWAARSMTLVPHGGAVAWFEPGQPGISLDVLLRAHAAGAVVWPDEAGIVVITQLVEGLCAFHDRLGAHGALRPELVFVGTDGRVSLMLPDPSAGDDDFQPESVRLGAAPTPATDAFGWWRLAHAVLRVFPRLAGARAALPRAPSNRAALIAAADGIRRWAVEAGFDPTATHLARGARLAERAPRLAWVGGQTSDENARPDG